MRTHYLEYIGNSIVKAWDMPAMTNYKKNSFTYGEIAEHVARYHILFEKIGLKKGDKVALCGPNSAEWGIAFLAVTTYEAVAVPLLNDFLSDSVMTLTDHSESRIFFVSREIWEKVDIARMPLLEVVICLEDSSILFAKYPAVTEVRTRLDDLFKEKYPAGFGPGQVHYPTDNLDDLALINYTSGTTSAPKGVMLTYRNISSNIQFGQSEIPNGPGDTLVSMLPMAHMYGMAFEFLYQLAGGTQVFFLGKVPSPKVLLDALATVKPYMMITVPLVVEKIFKSSVFPTIRKPIIRSIMKVPGLASIIHKQIRQKLLYAFGGKMRNLIIGGAAINQEVEDLMKAIKLPYTIGYGMTECGPLLAYEDASRFVKGSCGKPVHRMSLRVDSDNPCAIVGELQARGDNVMMGYYKSPETTAAAFTKDGWLRTGDLGLIDKDNNVFIKGRSKNLIIGANGQNIYPEEIEDKLNNQPYVVESIVVERDKKLVALVFPDYNRVSQESLDSMNLAQLMEENRMRLNMLLPIFSRIHKIELQPEAFEKTPKRSIKRFLYK
ncbi:MAG: AMP-binding protein [Bacteroidales bacterium]|jgi:long-chain acyl-CoA synthetase|nr:AMP-binding protein [Bacteroidales bacterium]MDD2264271.1 AMP-binding protein [Bacteroidales bacterium]MDD2831505.1 AMP-binding protein [Bacteroidales bacterium]MDD3208499.1 AMP-binding protein [Bacteroidales bacterium]MDD3697088.1 AMP-binding protein [Bacteroidales bacterium]